MAPRTHIDHFRARCLQDALAAALPVTWTRRADDLERVGSPAADESARACRRHAWLLEREGVPQAVLEELLAELDATVTQEGAA